MTRKQTPDVQTHTPIEWIAGGFTGNYSAVLFESADGEWRINETYSRPSRPFYVTAKDRGTTHTDAKHLGFGQYGSTDAAKRAVELKARFLARIS